MGIPQLPSGAFQVRFQHRHVAYVATFTTRELADIVPERAPVVAERDQVLTTGQAVALLDVSRPTLVA